MKRRPAREDKQRANYACMYSTRAERTRIHIRTRAETKNKIWWWGWIKCVFAESKCRLVISGRTIINLRRGREICQARDAAAAICTAINWTYALKISPAAYKYQSAAAALAQIQWRDVIQCKSWMRARGSPCTAIIYRERRDAGHYYIILSLCAVVLLLAHYWRL